MGTLEATISMLRVMPEAEVQVIFDMTKTLFDKRLSPFQPVRKEQVLRDLELSEEQIANGQFHDARSAILELKARYGVSGQLHRMTNDLRMYEADRTSSLGRRCDARLVLCARFYPAGGDLFRPFGAPSPKGEGFAAPTNACYQISQYICNSTLWPCMAYNVCLPNRA